MNLLENWPIAYISLKNHNVRQKPLELSGYLFSSDYIMEIKLESDRTLHRDSVRIGCSDIVGLMLNIKREDGSNFDATIEDLSVGGCCFILPDDEFPIPEGTQLDLTFYWCEDIQIIQHGTLSRMHTRQNKVTGHVRFCVKNHESIWKISELVTHIERIHLRARHNWSPTETESLGSSYRPSKTSHARKKACCRH